MDTLHVCSSSSTSTQQNSHHNSKTPSRSASPCHSDQMSKDRDSGDSASGGGGGSGSGFRFRNHSPSTQRRSRERERRDVQQQQAANHVQYQQQQQQTPQSSQYQSNSQQQQQQQQQTPQSLSSQHQPHQQHHHQQHQQQSQQQQQQQFRDVVDGGNIGVILTDDDQFIEMLDDSKLSGEELGYQSFVSDEIEGNINTNNTNNNNNNNINNSTSNNINFNNTNNINNNNNSLKRHRHHHHRSNSGQALDRLSLKIACTKDSIRKEQTVRDENVNEYLKLAANADKHQLQRIKAVFEKKNQKSAHTIVQLQKKLESYSKKVKDLQVQQTQKQGNNSGGTGSGGVFGGTGSGGGGGAGFASGGIGECGGNSGTGGSSGSGTGGGGGAGGISGSGGAHRQPREVLRDVGQGLKHVGGNIRDGISGLSGSVMSKPREFAHLIKNKFGSADNINQLSSTWYTDPELNTINLSSNNQQMDNTTTNNQQQQHHHHHHHNSGTPNNTLSGAAGGAGNSGTIGSAGGGGSGKFSNENESECSSVTSDSLPAGSGKHQSSQHHFLNQYSSILKPILAELQERKEDCEKLKEKLERLENVQKEFQDVSVALESERYRSERLEEQINDLTELHQTEIENLKQTVCDMEEKVQYQSDERLRDVNEVLENCQTRISKMEHMSQQQYVTVEGIDNSNARALVAKLINVVLIILQVILLLVATAAGIIMPFLKTRLRVLTTFFFVFLAIFVVRQWPDVKDIGSHVVRHLKESLIVK